MTQAMFNITFRKTLLALIVVSTTLVTGCATQAKVDAFTETQKKVGIVYGQVNRVFSDDDLLSTCKSGKGDPEMLLAACSDASNSHLIQVGMLIDGASHIRGEVIAKSLGIQPGMIVKLDMSKPKGLHFVEIAARKESDSCKWAGHYNNMLDRGRLANSGEIIGGVALGALAPVVGAATLVTGRNITGGVECNGWSYKESFKDFLDAN